VCVCCDTVIVVTEYAYVAQPASTLYTLYMYRICTRGQYNEVYTDTGLDVVTSAIARFFEGGQIGSLGDGVPQRSAGAEPQWRSEGETRLTCFENKA